MDQLTTEKTHVAGGSQWTVRGQFGAVAYTQVGNQLALLSADGDVDSMGKEYADEARSVSEYFDDNTVFELLADHYRTKLRPQSALT